MVVGSHKTNLHAHDHANKPRGYLRVKRVRISWGLYICVRDFEKEWQKGLHSRAPEAVNSRLEDATGGA
ncbi:hypothetical protein [Bradyrhizobium diazoefficiens]